MLKGSKLTLTLKFVLLRNGDLYIAHGNRNYHQDMTDNAPRSDVKAAGWVEWSTVAQEGYCHSRSIGYGISFNDADEALILKTMENNSSPIQQLTQQNVVVKLQTNH